MFSGLKKPLRVAVLISGSGSTLQSFLEMQHQVDISLVISNQQNAAGLLKANRFGKKTLLIQNPVDYEKLDELLVKNRIDRILLAGFMKLVPERFVKKWGPHMMNIHPSLLPLYPGLHAAEKSWKDQKAMGVSIHQVNAGMDEGQIFLQQMSRPAPVETDSDFEWPQIFLRRTEQHLLRELSTRWN